MEQEGHAQSSKGVEILFASEANWQQIRDLRLRAVREEPRSFVDTEQEASLLTEEIWRTRLKESVYVCATQGGDLVGMVCAVPERKEKTKHIAWIYGVYVAPEVRSRGVGRMLMEEVMRETKKRFPAVIKFALNATLDGPAIQLYESLGFKKIGLLEKEARLNGEYLDEWAMVKFIEE